ncbi:MAG: DEAD/DEAH box helicase family protein [Nitrospira sp.]|nr:DEAD/DEAH box helicase family protein [Nitrospira sp.]
MSVHDDIVSEMADIGMSLFSSERSGLLFHDSLKNTCIVIDVGICDAVNYQYVDYTSRQNDLFNRYQQVYRFLHNQNDSLTTLMNEVREFINNDADPEGLRCFGRNRTEQDIDPTMPEAVFEDCFIDAFGYNKLSSLHKEFEYYDLDGKRRFIDYALFSDNYKIAIELNGEQFHHPCSIGAKKYSSQLFKQNSLVVDGFKVFRWSLRGMQDREKIVQELRLFLGDSSGFIPKASLKGKRSVSSFTLYEHQKDSLAYLDKERGKGRKTFLIVLPTGTGKTEIFIEDFKRLYAEDAKLSALVIVPTRKLREQTIKRFKERTPQLVCSESIFSSEDADVHVQTSAYFHRHYFKLKSNAYDYIVVDEAHHAVASGLRSVLEHFQPDNMIGLTATPDRLDQLKLEEVFGEYETALTLQEAIEQGIVPPVRCFRIKSNIDLTEVRFNGKEYVKSDLNRTFIVSSRDELVAKVMVRFFSGEFRNKQGVIFCVDINHTQRMAQMLCKYNLSAMPISGRDATAAKKAIDDYHTGKVRFLCACDLLSEGWDAPQTSIIVMARPTFSRVLYTQQLGRGTRTYPGKEALYILDVVDNYGAKLQPLSLHALFGINLYKPFDNVVAPKQSASEEIIVLDGLFEDSRRVEPVDIFNYDELYGNYLNEEQLARELFVSTGTVKAWLKKGEIKSDIQHPFGRRNLHFFDPQQAYVIREKKGLKSHSDDSRKEDFMEFLKERNYTFSFKMIFLLSYLKVRNERDEAALPDVLQLYQQFYRGLLNKYNLNDKKHCPYNRLEYLDDSALIQRSILDNPFEKFERKRFFYHCTDLNYIAMDAVLHEKLMEKDFENIQSQMIEDLKNYYEKLGISLQEDDFRFLIDENYSTSIEKVVFIEDPTDEEKFKSALPYYPLSIAAGDFSHSETWEDPEQWISAGDLFARNTFNESMFIAQIHGHSMEPTIPDGSYCLFTRDVLGSRNNEIVLARKLGIADADTGGNFTLKRYVSTKSADPDTDWVHESITLKPDNPKYQDIVILPEDAEDFAVVAFMLEVLNLK